MNHPETIITVVCSKLAKIASLHAKRWIVEKDILEYWVLRCLKPLMEKKYCRHQSINHYPLSIHFKTEIGTICLRPNIANLSLCQLQAPHLSGRSIASVLAWDDLQISMMVFPAIGQEALKPGNFEVFRSFWPLWLIKTESGCFIETKCLWFWR